MSESLPGTAPQEQSAVPSVEDSAPDDALEVATDSARGEESVPASRFNGLMGRFNRTQNELEAANRRIAELEAQPPAQEKDEMTDTSGLEQQIAQLQQLLVSERLESARTKAFEQYPEAKAFADLIVGADTPEAIVDMARVLHERVADRVGDTTDDDTTSTTDAEGAEPPPAADNPSTEPPAPPAAPQVAGGTSILPDGQADAQERVVDAIKRKSFSDFLRAKFEAQHGGGDLVL